MLWLYGSKDSYYALTHSKKNFDAFIAAGRKGNFVSFEAIPGGNGHHLHAAPALWQSTVDSYLQQVAPPR